MTKIGVVVDAHKVKTLFEPDRIERLNALGEVSWCRATSPISDREAIEILSGCEIGIGSWGTPGPLAPIVEACPQLKLWIHAAGTVKSFFGPHLEGRSLAIASCAPAIAVGVAEMTVGELIMGLRRVLENARANREGGRPRPTGVVGMREAIIGVVGASHVGREVIRLLAPFRCRILVYDPFLSTEEARALGVEKCDGLVQLCADSHAVTLHTPAIPATRHMMGAAQFGAMRDDAVFVNTARGMCVDEAALIAELRKGRLTAFLDVSDPEPTADDSPFRALPNCYYTSHIAGGAHFAIGAQVVEDVEAYLDGRPVKMAVTKEMLERLA